MNTSTNTTSMNNTAKISAMSQALYNKGLEPTQAIVLSAALIEMKEKIGHKNWERVMERTVRNIPFTIDGNTYEGVEIDGWVDTLVSANLLTREEDVLSDGPYLEALYQEKERAYPRLATEGVETRRRKLKNNNSGMITAIEVLEKTQYQVDEVMLKLHARVYAKLGKGKLTSEQYVIDACFKLVDEGNQACVSEFFDDHRGRMYQGDVHGGNGQSSDLARSITDLSGVSQDYDPEAARELIMEEMQDMSSFTFSEIRKEVEVIKSCNSFNALADYMVDHIKDNRSKINKVGSFVKAAGYLIKLDRGELPYIGMAFGKDAKCSGPQLAALMTSDEELAEACGFAETRVNDAYLRVIDLLDDSWSGVTRNCIKKPFMATFYGQNWRALTISDNYGRVKKSDMEFTILDCMLNDAGVTRDTNPEMVEEIIYKHWDVRAMELANAIEDSFGKVSSLRKAIKEAHGEWIKGLEGELIWMPSTHKATTHVMPDGVKVRMPYYKYVDIAGKIMEYGSIAPTVEMTVRGEDMKFNEITFKTKEEDLGRHGRTGFVNLVQATDGQLARFIVRNLDEEGAQHVVSVHDCFRVNIHDMLSGKLDVAIKRAYMELFGDVRDVRTEKTPRGTDIMGMYFKGVNKSKQVPGYIHSQFESGERVLHDFMDMPDLINSLGVTTTYFDK